MARAGGPLAHRRHRRRMAGSSNRHCQHALGYKYVALLCKDADTQPGRRPWSARLIRVCDHTFFR
jgi:hypothetical protein